MQSARADFVSSWIVAIAAIALYVGQAISRAQFADVIHAPSHSYASVLIGVLGSFALGMTLPEIVVEGYRKRDSKKMRKKLRELLPVYLPPLVFMPAVGLFLQFYFGVQVKWRLVASGVLFAVLFGFTLSVLNHWLGKLNKQRRPSEPVLPRLEETER